MHRELVGYWKWMARVGAISFTSFQLYTGGFGIFPDMQQRAIHVLFGFTLTLLLRPVKRKAFETKVPFYDVLLIVLTIACCVNTYAKFEWFHYHLGESTLLDLFLGVAIVILALETGRRVIGWVFPLITLIFLIYAFLGSYIPGKFSHPGFDLTFVIQTLNQTTKGVWGFITGISATIVAIFIIFGSVLLFTGGGQTFIDLSLKLAGKFRGGPALVAVVASGLFGTVSGSSVANVATTGNFTIPLMKRLGYPPKFAGGVEAAASTGGQIMPPIMGAAAFIMAELLDMPYVKLIWAALIPALLYYIAVFAAVRFESLKLNLSPVPEGEIRSIGKILTWRKMAPLVIPLGILVGLLIKGYTPATSGFWAIMASIFLFLFLDFSLVQIKQRGVTVILGLEKAGIAMIEIVSLLVCANIVVSLINLTGVGIKISELVLETASIFSLLGLICGAGVSLILGMGIPTAGAYLIVAAVMGPAFEKLGFTSLASHLFLFYFAVLSSITPPVCVAVFTASAIARASWVKIAGVALRLTLIAFVIPFIFAYEPALIMIGNPLDIIVAFITAAMAAIFIGAIMMGYLNEKLSVATRMLLIPGVAALLLPGLKTDFIGMGIIGTVLIMDRLFKKRKQLARIQ